MKLHNTKEDRLLPALVSIFGTKSPLSSWGARLVQAAMQVAHGDYHLIQTASIEDLRAAWSERGERSVVFVCECPDAYIGDLFIKYKAPIIAFCDDPMDILGYLLATGSPDPFSALRLASQCLSTLSDVLRSPETLFIGSEYYNRDARDLIANVLDVVAGSVESTHVERVMAVVAPNFNEKATVGDLILRYIPHAQLPGHFGSKLTSDVQNVIERCISQYQPILNGEFLTTVVWPKELFSDWGPFELVGPSRYLISGPYMYLPQGVWTASAEIEVSDNKSGNVLVIDTAVNYGTIIAAGIAELPVEGRFSVNLEFSITEPQQPIEIRFFLKNGAIEGKFALWRLELHRTANAMIERRSSFGGVEY